VVPRNSRDQKLPSFIIERRKLNRPLKNAARLQLPLGDRIDKALVLRDRYLIEIAE
jgi:hypothetical protein